MSERGAALQRQELFGLSFVDAESPLAVADVLLRRPRGEFLDAAALPVVITPNVDILVKRDRGLHPDAEAVVRGAGVVLPDGQPIVWAGRWLRRPLSARLPGSELVRELWPKIVADSTPVMVIAPSDLVAHSIHAAAPHAVVVVAPMLDVARGAELADFAQRCTDVAVAANAELVFVAIGFPKQCNLIHGMLAVWPDSGVPPLFLAVGASFEMFFGHVRRAPRWMQRSGLEWCFRLLQEPRRLARRYLVDDPHFVRLLAREWRATRGQSRR